MYYGYPTHLTVAIDQLPASGFLSYDRETQHVRYHGLQPIHSLVADYSSQIVYFPPGARIAHVDITDLPTDLDLNIGTDAGGKHVVLDTGGQPLGHLDFWLVSDQSLIPALDTDGVALRDDCPEGVICTHAPFAFRGRVTRLRHLDYTEHPGVDTTRSVDLTRDPNGSGRGEPVTFDLRKKNPAKADEIEYVNVVYNDPPPAFHVDATKRTDDSIVLTYWGAAGRQPHGPHQQRHQPHRPRGHARAGAGGNAVEAGPRCVFLSVDRELLARHARRA